MIQCTGLTIYTLWDTFTWKFRWFISLEDVWTKSCSVFRPCRAWRTWADGSSCSWDRPAASSPPTVCIPPTGSRPSVCSAPLASSETRLVKNFFSRKNETVLDEKNTVLVNFHIYTWKRFRGSISFQDQVNYRSGFVGKSFCAFLRSSARYA